MKRTPLKLFLLLSYCTAVILEAYAPSLKWLSLPLGMVNGFCVGNAIVNLATLVDEE